MSHNPVTGRDVDTKGHKPSNMVRLLALALLAMAAPPPSAAKTVTISNTSPKIDAKTGTPAGSMARRAPGGLLCGVRPFAPSPLMTTTSCLRRRQDPRAWGRKHRQVRRPVLPLRCQVRGGVGYCASHAQGGVEAAAHTQCLLSPAVALQLGHEAPEGVPETKPPPPPPAPTRCAPTAHTAVPSA